jgi:protein-S-isoprenylcysteine O-methyltransferase Ste14
VTLTMDESRFKVVRAIQLGSAVLILLIIIFYSGPWNVWRTVGLAIALPAMILLFFARFQLGRSFAVTPQAKVLVTHGLYSKMRNPMYVFAFLLVTGFLIALQKPYAFPLLAILLVVQVVRARQEARVLEQKFGQEYQEYRAKTWF